MHVLDPPSPPSASLIEALPSAGRDQICSLLSQTHRKEMERSTRRRLLLFSSCRCNKVLPSAFFFFFFFFSSCLVLLGSHGAEGYKNYTVGDDLGWYDNLMQPKVNYQKWVAGKNFSLGDFLIFNTDRNHSVVQTYNATTYRRCDYNNAEDDDTTEWSTGEPTVVQQAVSVAVPLVKVGPNYFFSGNYDGEQCRHGQRFKVTVARGQGLPESLRTPPAADSPAPASQEDDGTAPDKEVPSNFSNPAEVGAVKESRGERRAAIVGFGRLLLPPVALAAGWLVWGLA